MVRSATRSPGSRAADNTASFVRGTMTHRTPGVGTYLAVALLGFPCLAVGTARAQEVDASKPTNFYPTLDNSLEYNARDAGGNLMGYRAQLIYPPSDKHLFLFEVPLLYNDATEKFGVGDLRGRYFFLPYKNYDTFLGAFGPSVDIFAPTGSYPNGLGSSSWSISPGLTAGLMIADWIQAFPIVSYVYASKPTTDAIPEAQKRDRHGLSIQAVIPVVFSPKVFSQITPVYSVSDFKDGSLNRYVQEVLVAYSLTPTLQTSVFWRGNFKDKDHTFRAGVTVFFVGS